MIVKGLQIIGVTPRMFQTAATVPFSCCMNVSFAMWWGLEDL